MTLSLTLDVTLTHNGPHMLLTLIMTSSSEAEFEHEMLYTYMLVLPRFLKTRNKNIFVRTICSSEVVYSCTAVLILLTIFTSLICVNTIHLSIKKCS